MTDSLKKVIRFRQIRNACIRDGLDSSFYIHEYSALIDDIGLDEFNQCMKAISAFNSRKSRIKKRFFEYLNMGPCLFLTFTFTDKVLSSTSGQTRREYVQAFLKSYSPYFVANIDFGDLNGREHYHALIKCDFVSHLDWTHGNLDFERVKDRLDSDTQSRIRNYLSKLIGHASKFSTGGCIFSRPKKSKFIEVYTSEELDHVFSKS